MDVSFNGIRPYRKGQAAYNSILIPLPRELWRESGMPGRCSCQFCKETPDVPDYWDTLSFFADPKTDKDKSRDTIGTVHAPELHMTTRRAMQAEIDRAKLADGLTDRHASVAQLEG